MRIAVVTARYDTILAAADMAFPHIYNYQSNYNKSNCRSSDKQVLFLLPK